MSEVTLKGLRGRRLGECYLEYEAAGALRTWAPFTLDVPGLRGLEIRFNNHWGRLIDEDSLRYQVTVTDQRGRITHEDSVILRDLESGVVRLDAAGDYPRLGAIYLGCVSPSIVAWSGEDWRVGDYFYLAYYCEDSYAMIHAQPVEMRALPVSSSFPNCIEVLASESPKILIGNPGVEGGSGDIRLHAAPGGRRRKVSVSLEPFEVTSVDLRGVPDGWYAVDCNVGKAYAHLVRSSGRAVIVRHM